MVTAAVLFCENDKWHKINVTIGNNNQRIVSAIDSIFPFLSLFSSLSLNLFLLARYTISLSLRSVDTTFLFLPCTT